jgi:hypothetical protein
MITPMTDKTEMFWEWFREHCRSYLNIDDLEEDVKEQLLDELLEHLHQYCDQLYFEIGETPAGKPELIVTAEGKTDFFNQVEYLVNSAPVIDDWLFTAFIQPLGGGNVIKYEDVELKTDEMWFLPLENKSKPASIGIKVCMPDYDRAKESEWFEAAVYKVLDTVLGEKSFALDIDHVGYGKLPDEPAESGMIELAELPAYLKWKKTLQGIS